MESRTENGVLVIFLEGRIDSSNARSAAEEIDRLIGGPDGRDFLFDAEKLTYISSAGLRLVLKLKKEAKKNLILVQVREEVYEVFSTTGLTEVFSVVRIPKELDLSESELIGQGASGKVYRIQDDAIVKMYPKGYSILSLIREKEASRKALIRGVPTAIPYGLVCTDGMYGLQYELVGAMSLQRFLVSEPESLENCMRQYVCVFRDLHEIEVDDGTFPSAKEMLLEDLKKCEPYYDREVVLDLQRVFEMIPQRNTLVHRDFHPGNVMVDRNKELYLIDMGEISTGHPVIDFMSMGIHYPIMINREALRAHAPRFHDGLSIEMHEKLWNMFLEMYFNDRSESERQAIDTTIDALSICMMALNPTRMVIRDEEHLDRVIKRFTTLWDEGKDTVLAIKNLDIFDE